MFVERGVGMACPPHLPPLAQAGTPGLTPGKSRGRRIETDTSGTRRAPRETGAPEFLPGDAMAG